MLNLILDQGQGAQYAYRHVAHRINYSPPYHGKNKAIVVICMLPDKIYSPWCTNCERGTSLKLVFKRSLSFLNNIYSLGRHFGIFVPRQSFDLHVKRHGGTW